MQPLTMHLSGPRMGLAWFPQQGASRHRLRVLACAPDRSSSRKGKQFENKQRRRGRPAWLRTPYDTPLRDGNRDRLIGLLTERAAKTLMVYLMETNPTVYSWLVNYYKENTIPKTGSWDDVSGETFLRKLLAMPVEAAKLELGRDALFDNLASQEVDPRNLAQRIMDIRSQLAEEFIQDLKAVAEENSLLLRETLTGSLSMDVTVDHPCDKEASSSSQDSSSGTASRAGSPGSSGAGQQQQQRPQSPPDKELRASFRPRPVRPSRPLEPLDGSAAPGISPAEKATLVAALSAAFSKEVVPGAAEAASHPELLDAGSSSSSSSSEEEQPQQPPQPQQQQPGEVASVVVAVEEGGGAVLHRELSLAAATMAAASCVKFPLGWGPRKLLVAAAVAVLQNNIIECSAGSLSASAWPSSSEEEEEAAVGLAAAEGACEQQ